MVLLRWLVDPKWKVEINCFSEKYISITCFPIFYKCSSKRNKLFLIPDLSSHALNTRQERISATCISWLKYGIPENIHTHLKKGLMQILRGWWISIGGLLILLSWVTQWKCTIVQCIPKLINITYRDCKGDVWGSKGDMYIRLFAWAESLGLQMHKIYSHGTCNPLVLFVLYQIL